MTDHSQDQPETGLSPGGQRARAALDRTGVAYRPRTQLPRSRSLEEHAAAIGVAPSDVTKTLVVRRGEDDYFFLLVPGGRKVVWKKVRAALGVNRLTMPGADEARDASGYMPGRSTRTVRWSIRRAGRSPSAAATTGPRTSWRRPTWSGSSRRQSST